MVLSTKGRVFFLALVVVLLSSLGEERAYANAGLSATPSSLNFGSVAANTSSAPTAISLMNVGNQRITIQQVSSSSPQFLVSGPSLPITLSSRQRTSFTAVFSPSSRCTFTR